MYTTITVTGTISRSTIGGWKFEGEGTAIPHDFNPRDTDNTGEILTLRCCVGEVIATNPVEGLPVFRLDIDASTELTGANA